MNRFENGFDSYKKTIRGLVKKDIDEYALKDIVINFHHSIEVLFKHILSQKNKSLVYREIDKWIDYNFDKRLGINKEKNIDSDVEYTITFDETVRRIVVLCEISLDAYTYEGFRRLGKLRNSLTHDELELNKEEVEQVVVNLLTMVMEVLANHLSKKEKEQFNQFVDSKEHEDILKGLYANNFRWRILTISNLLKLYSKKDYDMLTQAQIRNIKKMISALGIYVENDDMFLNIDGEYYITIISYLKQEMCNLILCCKEEKLKNKKINEILKKNETIRELLEEYLQKAALYIYGLIADSKISEIDNSFFDDSKKIDYFFKNSLLINKNDIFQILYCMKRITDMYVIIMEEKRRDDVLKKLFLGDDKDVSLKVFYSGLIDWFSNNGWYNIGNANKLSDIESKIFFQLLDESNYFSKFIEDVESRIYKDELYQEFIGEIGEWGSIDRIDYVKVEEVVTLVKEENEYIVILNVFFGTQTYCDHEYFDNGSENAYVSVKGNISNEKFVISDIEYMGRTIGFHSFRFD